MASVRPLIGTTPSTCCSFLLASTARRSLDSREARRFRKRPWGWGWGWGWGLGLGSMSSLASPDSRRSSPRTVGVSSVVGPVGE
eukprot:scaffold2191_cov254-Pinguiococcus_pyrenoidosus.AAC.17